MSVSSMRNPRSSMSSRARRPLYLVAALIGCWTLGVGGTMTGCATLRFYREPDKLSMEVHKPTGDGLAGLVAEQQRVARKVFDGALDLHRDRVVFLVVANILLSVLFLVACV